MHVLFANTGVQIVCVPLAAAAATRPTRSATAGSGALRQRAGKARPPRLSPTSSGRSSSPAPRGCSWPSTPPAATPRSATSARPTRLTKDFLVHLDGSAGPGGQAAEGHPRDRAVHPPGDGHRRRRQARAHGRRLRQQPHRRAAAGDGRRDRARRRRCCPSSWSTATTSTPGTRRARRVSLPAARWFSSKTHWCNTPYLPPLAQKKIEYHTVGDEDEPQAGWFGRGKQGPPGQGRGGGHAALVRRPLDGPHGPRGRRRGAGHAGRGRHPHRRQLAQALPLGRRRQLAGRGQLAHGRSGRPLQDGHLRLAAEGPLPAVRPRGRPRFPAPGGRAQGGRVRHRARR